MTLGTIAVIGATRGTGFEVARTLLAAGRPVAAVARDPDKARQMLGPAVQALRGDVTSRPAMDAVIDPGWAGIVFTVDITGGIGGRGMFAPAEKIRAVMYGGVVNTVDAARAAGFRGRFVLLSTIGLVVPSVGMKVLNWIKAGLRQHSLDKGAYLKASGLDWAIVKAGLLTNGPASDRRLVVDAVEVPLSARYRIGRADLARVMIAAVDEDAASRQEFCAYYGAGAETAPHAEAIAARLRELPR